MAKLTSHKASSGRFAYDGLDRVIHEKARLSVLTSLVAHPKGLVFGDLKEMCGLTDGNLSRHLQVLEEAGLIEIEKGYDHNRPQTLCRITAQGRRRYLDYLQVLEQVVRDAARTATDVSAPPLGAARRTNRLNFFCGGTLRCKVLLSDKRLHVAIIMDGNGRWATRRGLPRTAGHREGIQTVRRVVEAAPDLGVAALTLFAFSSDNWRRPEGEVRALMGLLRHYLRAECQRLIETGVRLTVIGRRDRLPDGLAAEIAAVEQASAARRRGSICGSRSTIRRATPSPMRRPRWGGDRDLPSRDAFARLLGPTRRSALPRRRSPDPHRRREAALRFPAVGSGLRGALFHRHAVAGLRPRRSARRAR